MITRTLRQSEGWSRPTPLLKDQQTSLFGDWLESRMISVRASRPQAAVNNKIVVVPQRTA